MKIQIFQNSVQYKSHRSKLKALRRTWEDKKSNKYKFWIKQNMLQINQSLIAHVALLVNISTLFLRLFLFWDKVGGERTKSSRDHHQFVMQNSEDDQLCEIYTYI